MEIKIRQEQENDYKVVYELIELAFRNMEESDHSEQKRLCQSFLWWQKRMVKL